MKAENKLLVTVPHGKSVVATFFAEENIENSEHNLVKHNVENKVQYLLQTISALQTELYVYKSSLGKLSDVQQKILILDETNSALELAISEKIASFQVFDSFMGKSNVNETQLRTLLRSNISATDSLFTPVNILIHCLNAIQNGIETLVLLKTETACLSIMATYSADIDNLNIELLEFQANIVRISETPVIELSEYELQRFSMGRLFNLLQKVNYCEALVRSAVYCNTLEVC